MDVEEALTFAAEGKVKATIETQPRESINDFLRDSRPERSMAEKSVAAA